MTQERFKAVAIVYVLLRDEGRILLARRVRTGHEDGNYSLIAGHVDAGESAMQAAVREAKEEAGVDIDPSRLKFVHAMHRLGGDEKVTFFFAVDVGGWTGAPSIREPELCDDMGWYKMSHLPFNTVTYVRAALDAIARGETYSELGWPTVTADGGDATVS